MGECCKNKTENKIMQKQVKYQFSIIKVTPNFRELPSYCIKSQNICHGSHIQNSIPNQQSEVEIQYDLFFIGQPE